MPCRLATNRAAFQSTLPARGATDALTAQRIEAKDISIHAPRTGSDSEPTVVEKCVQNFNPRSPHGERRLLK